VPAGERGTELRDHRRIFDLYKNPAVRVLRVEPGDVRDYPEAR
jgi:hypothetical protein